MHKTQQNNCFKKCNLRITVKLICQMTSFNLNNYYIMFPKKLVKSPSDLSYFKYSLLLKYDV